MHQSTARCHFEQRVYREIDLTRLSNRGIELVPSQLVNSIMECMGLSYIIIIVLYIKPTDNFLLLVNWKRKSLLRGNSLIQSIHHPAIIHYLDMPSLCFSV